MCSWQSTADMAAIIWKTFYAALTHGEDEGLKFTLPSLLQDMGELVHINRGAVVFSYLSKNWWEPNLESGQQEICDDLSSVVTWALWVVALLYCKVWHLGPHLCSVGQLGSPEWCRIVFYHWGWYMLTQIFTDLHLLNSVSNKAFSDAKTDTFPAIVESKGEAGDSSVKGIMDHYCLVQGTWHGHHAAWV